MNRVLGSAIAICLSALLWDSLRAWRTLKPEDWNLVADNVGRIVKLMPRLTMIHYIHARVLRAARRSNEAVTAGRRALAISPGKAALLLELGKALRQAGQRDEAISTLADAAARGSLEAKRELCRYAARAFLPQKEHECYARSDYSALIADHPAIAPLPTPPHGLFRVSLDNSPMDSATYHSLTAQTYKYWFLEHAEPTGDLSFLTIYDLQLPPGALLDPNCLAWFNRAISLTGASRIRADHDFVSPRGERRDPVFLPPAVDSFWSDCTMLIAHMAAHQRHGSKGDCHIPLVLMSLPYSVERNRSSVPDSEPLSISVVIPTRDNPDLLDVAISSLRKAAARPEQIEVIILDNGSRNPETLALFDRLREDKDVRIIAFDQPFNWSRANNLGAAAASGQALLFLNDDTSMLTAGWDRILAGLLLNPDVGLIGARMTYPDGSIQHGGFVFGMDNGPQHEGRWMPGQDAGPAGRWTAIRQSVGVTGAFMAIRAHEFIAAGGFDDKAFAVDFADLDMCLRLRKLGKAIVYCGAISLVHHESVSRGLNISRVKRVRMRQEWARFSERWGEWGAVDPWYNPVWSRTGASFDGLQALSIDDIERAILADRILA